MKGEPEREEIFKTTCIPNLHEAADKGTADEKFGAIGAISALILSEKHVAEVVTSKIIALSATMLVGSHARSRHPAAQFLSQLAQRPEYSAKVADLALIPLARALMEAGPGWSQSLQVQLLSANNIKALVENVVGDNPEVKQSRRVTLIKLGLVPWLFNFISTAPSMPKPSEYPAPPPLGKSGTSKSKGGDKSYPLGRRQAIATACAACLRFLALAPGFVEQVLLSGNDLQGFVDALLTASDVQAAYISGTLWEICSDATVAGHVLKCGAVPRLLHVLSKNISGALPKSASSEVRSHHLLVEL